jgi:hypothetical protein
VVGASVIEFGSLEFPLPSSSSDDDDVETPNETEEAVDATDGL